MSKEYVVLFVREPKENRDIEDMSAKVFMRFTEPPSDEFMQRLAAENPRHRVYLLSGASAWWKK